ncbi:hypothetical protein BU23DRAFT_45218 [Bimuria novae-zelandiae CBS 107.79]|uniref:FAD-binding FR-type domain-containing protein n=1 Tax=Bimuria novae-zelandiae CBS 107.79 TaxID=1447943 RepID=A0A6A5VIR2_9PLEO|nr:hypothetical protein BU23DRAFT_45218 [Bimuria novae-zelandiae CBS 107.79]
MSPHLAFRKLELPTSLTRRSDHFLEGWDANGYDSLKFSFGLAGVEQNGNFFWVNTFGYIFAVVAFALLMLRFSNMFYKHARHLTILSNPERQGYWKLNRSSWWPWLNRHVFMAPLHKKKHNATFQISSAIDNGTLPGRWHSCLLVVYGALNLAWCLALDYSLERKSVVAALRGRTGTLAALNLIPTVLFALRNNPLISILQVSYDDFNLFHRWAARITIIEAIAHTVCWLDNTANSEQGWSAVAAGLRDEGSYGYGMVATCAFTFLGIQAWSPFRHAFYETFLGIHRIMVLLSFIGLYEHLVKHGLPQVPWMHMIFAFYIFEWVARFTWAMYYNFGKQGCRVNIEAMPGEACRVTIHLAREWTPKPGCNVHLYIPSIMGPHSHPFSVAWAYPPNPSSKEHKERSLSQLEGGITLSSPHMQQRTKQISLICRARTGFTRTIYEKACEQPNKCFEAMGFIEGPYGGYHSLDSYGTCLLIAGGVGITHQVMYIKHLLAGAHNGTTATRRILLVWSLPDSESLEWIRPWMDEILRMPDRKKHLRIKLFITKPKGRIEQGNSESVKLFAGRPNWKTLLTEEMAHREGAMAVTCCGSGGLSDTVRAAVRPLTTEGCVDYIEEAFSY